MVVWEEKYEIGFEDIDKQHQSLFNYINELEGCIKDGEFEGTRLELILNFFQMFCATHFGIEETCMLIKKCPAGQKNKEAHGKFLNYFKNFRKGYKDSDRKRDLLVHFHAFLIKWLSDHIMKIDMRLKEVG